MILYMGVPVRYDQLSLLSTKDVCDQNSHFKLPKYLWRLEEMFYS